MNAPSKNLMKNTISILALSILPSVGATVWQPAQNALASASWDIFTFESATVGDSGSHGSAQAETGSLITTSDLSSETIAAYDQPPGGFLGNPDTYYFHNGGATWTATAGLEAGVSYVRVSYSLLGFDGGAAEAYANGPDIVDATLINSGTYATENSQVFFSDFAVTGSPSTVTTAFGDTPIGQSFRSIDAVQLEVFNTVPVPVPEPSSALLSGLASLALLRRRRA